jgi:hypothetical protein
MPGCESCTAEGTACPDTLATLQQVCHGMEMEMCSEYNSMCAVNGDAMEYFCSNRGGTFDPPMRMYFHTGTFLKDTAYNPSHSSRVEVSGRL